MSIATLMSQVLPPVILVALIVFLARRSMLWMLFNAYRDLREVRIRLTIKYQVATLLLARRLATMPVREKR
jgi:hypothetical protein